MIQSNLKDVLYIIHNLTDSCSIQQTLIGKFLICVEAGRKFDISFVSMQCNKTSRKPSKKKHSNAQTCLQLKAITHCTLTNEWPIIKKVSLHPTMPDTYRNKKTFVNICFQNSNKINMKFMELILTYPVQWQSKTSFVGASDLFQICL